MLLLPEPKTIAACRQPSALSAALTLFMMKLWLICIVSTKPAFAQTVWKFPALFMVLTCSCRFPKKPKWPGSSFARKSSTQSIITLPNSLRSEWNRIFHQAGKEFNPSKPSSFACSRPEKRLFLLFPLYLYIYIVFADQFENSSDRLKRVNFAIVMPKCQTNKRFT